LDQLELADTELRSILMVREPVRDDLVETVIAVSAAGRVRLLATSPADHTDRKSLQLATDQSGVPRVIEILVPNLLLGDRILPPVAGVDDLVTVVPVVGVAAVEDDRVSALLRG